jgi:hypothetical protein
VIKAMSRNFYKDFSKRNIGAIAVFVLVNWGVWNGGYAADDGPNSLVPYWTKYLNGSSGFQSWIEQTELWTNGWIKGQGRFFPTAVAVSRGAFIFITSLQIYKLVQLISMLILVILIASMISRKLKSPTLFAPSILLSTVLVQVRHDFDPYFAFSFLLPLTMILLLLISLAVDSLEWTRHSKNLSNLLLLMALSFLCFTTYEYSLILSPVLLILAFDSSRNLPKDKLKSLFVVGLVAATLVLLTLLVFRPRRENKLPSYEFAFNFVPFLKAFFSQLLAPLPFSQQLFGTLTVTSPHRPFLFIGIALILFLTVPFKVENFSRPASKLPLLFSGIYLWVVPAALVALTQRWQVDNALSFGKSYLPVLFQVVGVSFIFFFFYAFLKESLGAGANAKNVKEKKKRTTPMKANITKFDRVSLSILISIPLYFVGQANFQQFGDGKTQSARLEMIQIAAKSGWLQGIPDGARIVSWDMNDATPINKAVFSIESGIDLSMFNHPQDFLTMECVNDSNCNPLVRFLELSQTQNRLIEGERKEIQKKSSLYQGDVLFYTPNASIFTLSPINLSTSVNVDRRKTRVFWIRGISDPLVAKVIGEKCVQPPKESFYIGNREVRRLDISIETEFPIMQAIDRGKTCPLE